MCFAPWVSLSTAFLEFFVATFILIRYKDYIVPGFSAILIYTLGIYQTMEFMLCTSNNIVLWATLGFMTYTFLPAIGVHMAIRFTREKFNNYAWYLPPIIFTLIAFLKNDFILSAGCDTVFVSIMTIFTDSTYTFPYSFYLIYYFGFIMIASFLFVLHIHDKQMRKIYFWWIGMFIFTIIAPVFLLVLIPNLGMKFPSVYCEFSLLFTIAAVASSEIYHKKKRKTLISLRLC